jgi:hypothetical protein
VSHADRKLLAVALARAPQRGSDRELAVGGLTATDRPPGSGSGDDPLQSLIETLAYLADVLSVELDELADEAFIETTYDRGHGVLRIEFKVDVRPVVCVVLDPDNVYVATVGGQTDDSCVRFGEGQHGRRPPAGFEMIGATYRHGAGAGGGGLDLTGLALGEPIWLIAVSGHHRPLFRRVGCRDARAAL